MSVNVLPPAPLSEAPGRRPALQGVPVVRLWLVEPSGVV